LGHGVWFATLVLSLHAHRALTLSHAIRPVEQGALGLVVHEVPTAHDTQAPVVSQKPPVHPIFAVVRAQPEVSVSVVEVPAQLPEAHA
jgi:hypothetical protein